MGALIYGRPEGMTIEHCILSAAFDREPTTCRDLCVQKHPNVQLNDPAGYRSPSLPIARAATVYCIRAQSRRRSFCRHSGVPGSAFFTWCSISRAIKSGPWSAGMPARYGASRRTAAGFGAIRSLVGGAFRAGILPAPCSVVTASAGERTNIDEARRVLRDTLDIRSSGPARSVL